MREVDKRQEGIRYVTFSHNLDDLVGNAVVIEIRIDEEQKVEQKMKNNIQAEMFKKLLEIQICNLVSVSELEKFEYHW